jgi:hypothetical protein
MPSPAMASCDGMYAIPSSSTTINEEEIGCVGSGSALRVLSIDVGMKNLAYCLFECDGDGASAKNPESMMQLVKMVAWDTVNLCDAATDKPVVPVLCTQPGCKFAAKFAHTSCSTEDGAIVTSHYCTRHANSSGYKMPLQPSIAAPKILKKLTLEELKAFSGEYLSSPLPEKCVKSKVKLLQHLTVALANEYLVAVSAKPKVVSAASVDLITIGRNMHRRFDALPHIASGIDVVIIENQLSTLATRMKTLQGMITQYFIMRGVPDIRFISATNKLKLFSKGLGGGGGGEEGGEEIKDGYADRKKHSIEITRSLLSAHAATTTNAMKFEKHKKKDDLADCFLQGMWWLCTREKM